MNTEATPILVDLRQRGPETPHWALVKVAPFPAYMVPFWSYGPGIDTVGVTVNECKLLSLKKSKMSPANWSVVCSPAMLHKPSSATISEWHFGFSGVPWKPF